MTVKLSTLERAIAGRQRMSIYYKGGRRVIEPYEIQGNLLKAYQDVGVSNRGQGQGYKSFFISEIRIAHTLKTKAKHI